MTHAHGMRVGASLTAALVEGAGQASDWARWERLGRVPPLGEGNGFASRVGDDLALLAAHGLGAVRYTPDWSRLEPDADRHDGDAWEHVDAVLDAARSVGLEVWLGLHHVVSPGWFVDAGGFADDRARTSWSRFVDRCAERFGDRVSAWVPIVEPGRLARQSMLLGTWPPGQRDGTAFGLLLRGLVLAERDASRLLRGPVPIASCWDLAPVHAADDERASSQRARRWDAAMWETVVRAVRDGELAVPGRAVEEPAHLAGWCDVLGFTHHGAIAVGPQGPPIGHPPRMRHDDLGRVPWAEALAITARRLAEEVPGRPVALLGTGIVADDPPWQAETMADAVAVMAEVAADVTPVAAIVADHAVDGPTFGTGRVPCGLFDDARHPREAVAVLAGASTPGGTLPT